MITIGPFRLDCVAAACVATAIALASCTLHAQETDLERSRKRLEDIRRERDQLQEQQQRLQGQVHDVNDELNLIVPGGNILAGNVESLPSSVNVARTPCAAGVRKTFGCPAAADHKPR